MDKLNFEIELELKFYKNFKEICNALGINVLNGNAKKSLIKKIDSLYEYKRIGNGYLIMKKRDKPKEIVDMRGKTNNSSIFIDDISDLILYECSKLNKEDYYFIDLSSSMLSLKLGMINLNYIDSRFYKKKFSIKYNKDEIYRG